MKYFYLEPEVAGGLGKDTIIDHSVHPPSVIKLHYQFDGWLGDTLLECFPCYIISKNGKHNIDKLGLSGISYDNVEITVSEQFKELNPDIVLPEHYWMKIDGKAGCHDFGISCDLRLVVSERALEALKKSGLAHALISDYSCK